MSYEQLRLKLKDWHNRKLKVGEIHSQPSWIPVCAGASARTLAAICVSPLELIRTKMQSQKLSYLGKLLVFLWPKVFPLAVFGLIIFTNHLQQTYAICGPQTYFLQPAEQN